MDIKLKQFPTLLAALKAIYKQPAPGSWMARPAPEGKGFVVVRQEADHDQVN